MPKWTKLGKVFCSSGEFDWMQTHAAVPIAEYMKGDIYKIIFTARNKQNRSYGAYVIIDINEPTKILHISQSPLIVPGDLGTFDDSGAMPHCLCEYNGKKYLFYIGWNLGVTVPFRNSIGLAVSEDGDTYRKMFPGPIVDRIRTEPQFCAGPHVLPPMQTRDGVWRMYYLSCINWHAREGNVEHKYHIKYAESENGYDWKREGKVAIDFQDDDEYAISRPFTIFENGIFKMWFSSRAIDGIPTYRIRYAESCDGIHWTRTNNPSDVGIDVSLNGWDSEMIEYPCVFDHKGWRYMLYNGNDYGKTGFGLAVLEK
jgi:hypothetical protein